MRILLVGNSRGPHNRLSELGHQLVFFISKAKVFKSDVDGIYQDIHVFEDLSDTKNIFATARAMHEVQSFDRVLCFNDSWQKLAGEIASELGIPSNVNPIVQKLLANKNQLREALAGTDIASCQFELAHNEQELSKAIQKIGFPCIVKPNSGEGSKGIYKLENNADFEHCIENATQIIGDGSVIVEEWLVGPEFSVEAISENGKHYILGVTKKYKDQDNFVEIGHVFPAPISKNMEQQIRQYVEDLLTELRYNEGPSHTEVIFSKDGPIVVESHTRMGGDQIPRLVLVSTGVDSNSLIAEQSLGISVSARLEEKISYKKSAAVWFGVFNVDPKLKITKISGFDSIKEKPFVHFAKSYREVGNRGRLVKDSFDRFGLVLTDGKSPEEAVQRAMQQIASLEITYSPVMKFEEFAKQGGEDAA